MDFSHRLYELRRKAGLSQEELAGLLGVTRQAVQKWEAGTSRPDMDNLSALAAYFGVTLDWLIRGTAEQAPEQPQQPTVVNNYYHYGWHYEYKSRGTLFGLPLVHINLGRRPSCVARGIFAVGNIAMGLFALGGLSLGLFSLGGISLGLLLALGGLSLGGAAVGGLAIGLLALGGVAVGVLSIGGVALGLYAVGGVASGAAIAIGGVASAPLAIGDAVSGAVTFSKDAPVSPETIAAAVRQAAGGAPAQLKDLLVWLALHV